MEVVKIFDRHAEKYDKWYDKHLEIFESEVMAIKDIIDMKGLKLEVGVGTGRFASALGIEIGIDPAIKTLAFAKTRNIQVICSKGEFLPLRSSVIDKVFLIVTICFLDNPIPVLKEIMRVLKPNGILIVCFVPRESPWSRFYEEKAKHDHVFYKYAKFYSLNEVMRLLEESGFKVVDLRATLTYDPTDPPRVESPSKAFKQHGFVCLKAILTR